MNKSIFILKLKTEPIQNFYKNQITLVQFNAIFPYFKNFFLFENLSIVAWGNLGDDIIKYYRKGDYVIVEGVLNTIKNNQSIVDVKSEITSLQLTILKIYPLFTI
jgi:hypothetical protein|uniref:Photosystem I assembly protein Ycf4 n=2 Tax=Heterosigma akashiwo TaxID=2829 RepID=B2XT94_HETAK|nr:putative single-stranded DNA binding protein [Heterosigma akashiwo]ABV65992.1 putative single-stranded DNA binding protein [Heterosigma akashiwo]ABV70133.1 putative single-stranded DNA binding protein [Heterosigma akashiwo]BBA18198.1 photosystem I assembly protein Ycf4 [Heterosigma akashiwo]BBA18337.1 photosystem I assembly protein Ycf4 [Heterosigma akashiwo]BBA18476.1 photosystem I assembly protein Ycf4 [Heterosigma akashiwo]|mmetsp:Transcript_32155/g.47028  ORF Transcript_32155/g.47028 Transcript_32155/m.47028 type:complete len:105 (-) Transcript_32155:204-518(-)